MKSSEPRRLSLSASCALLLAVLVGILTSAASASASAEPPSQPAQGHHGLICHTEDAADCYPLLFQPSDEFQIVHDDQELPSGLHVRLNIWTGLKEAKINVPGEAATDPSVDGLPVVDQGVVVVNPPPLAEEEEPPTVPIRGGAPLYESAGKIKPPEHEAQFVYEALEALRRHRPPPLHETWFDAALERLEEVSHDIYYGLKITEDHEAVGGLLCLIVDNNKDAAPPVNGTTTTFAPRDQQAALILGGALQNNPTALKQLSDTYGAVVASRPSCWGNPGPLSTTLWESFQPAAAAAVVEGVGAGAVVVDSALDAGRVKAKVSAVNGLIKDELFRAEFLRHDGMKKLLAVLGPEGKEWAGAQRQAGQLALDNFLEPDMGATLGQWPRVPRLSDAECRLLGAATEEEGCWDFHVERIMKANRSDGSHWSRQLHDRLKEARNEKGQARHGEL